MNQNRFNRYRDFNPLSPCGERLVKNIFNCYIWLISIHSPHAGRDKAMLSLTLTKYIFQSTLPMRGETAQKIKQMQIYKNFNPLSPCGERQISQLTFNWQTGFQSTLPMRGETRQSLQQRNQQQNFNPLSPCGERQQN